MDRDLNLLKTFEDDPKDRKRRFLRGLNSLLGCQSLEGLENKDVLLREHIEVYDCSGILALREKLANIYCLEFTKEELVKLLTSGMTAGDFTEKYCAVIYRDRGKVDFSRLIGSSMVKTDSGLAVDLSKMDKLPKYGLNGREWCDVAEGPCSCGAWHH